MGRSTIRRGRVVKITRPRALKMKRKRLKDVLPAAGIIKPASKREKAGQADISSQNIPRKQSTTSKDVSTSEIPGMEEWAGLNVPLPLLHALSDLGFQCPTAIQREVLPIATLGPCDIIAAAETGSGKTLAFSIPILHYILTHRNGMETKVTKRTSPRQRSKAWEVYSTDEQGRKVIDLNQVIHGEGGEDGDSVTGEGGDGVTGEGSEDGDGETGEDGDGVTGEASEDGEGDSDAVTSENISSNLSDDGMELEVGNAAEGSHDQSHDSSRHGHIGFVGCRNHIPDGEFHKMLQGEIPPWGDDVIKDTSDDGSHELLKDDTTSTNQALSGSHDTATLSHDTATVSHDAATLSHDTATVSHEPHKLLALIMTPTRELALQIKSHISAVTKYTGIKVCAIVGGMATEKQERLLRQCPPVVIATPGRLWKLMSEGDPHLCCLDNLRYLVLDEADRMIEFGHYQELGRILDRIKGAGFKKKGAESGGTQRCNFVFSATLTLPRRSTERKRKRKNLSGNETIENLMSRIRLRKDAHVVDLTRSKVTVGGLTETKIMCTSQEKDVHLYYFLLKHPGRTLVFVNSIECLQRVKSVLELLRLLPRPLHAHMQQRQRIKNLERFTADPTGLLIATDVAARGLDIPQVQHVIHFQVPKNSELYVHRSGRTARAQEEGLSLLLVAPDDLRAYRNICQTLNRDWELDNFPVDPAYHQAVHERVTLANQIQALEHRQRRGQRADNWMKQSAEAMDIELEEELLERTPKLSKQDSVKLELLKVQLRAVLKKTVMPRGISLSFPTQRDQHLITASKKTSQSGGISQQKDALTVAKRKRF